MTPKSDEALAGFPEFMATIRQRLEVGRIQYGDASFDRPEAELIGEIEQELEDVCGWAFVLWTRLRKIKKTS